MNDSLLNFKKNFNNSVFEIKYNKNYDNYVKKNLKNILRFNAMN